MFCGGVQSVPQSEIAFQLTVGLVEMPAAPLLGEERVGPFGADGTQADAVVKDLTAESAIKAPLFDLTFQ
ncbi:MAG: hypothetical protein A2667_01555 [Candidatus Wildermuthbacteria bacterium RIFCSPHIGHO2_01_FULL_47_27]|nr:MAG: hypothetical protein A2667_01555 [Candidatus Wildermuthbacteria bacterium RIFCSPHIGHO2_01_FULL_47_27]